MNCGHCRKCYCIYSQSFIFHLIAITFILANIGALFGVVQIIFAIFPHSCYELLTLSKLLTK